MNRERFLRVLGMCEKAWAERYGIEPFAIPCEKCGAELETTVPFAVGQLRGLVSPPCECGNTDVPYCLVRDPKHGDLFTGTK